MYQITCPDCGQVGFHPSRVAAESRAEAHQTETGHDCSVETMEEV